MFWDPYDRSERERRRRLAEQRRRAEMEAIERARREEAVRRARAEQGGQKELPPEVIERFTQELAQARRERDEWADRYHQLLEQVEGERQALANEREQLATEAERQQERLRAEAETQRERLLRNAEQRAFEENRRTLLRMLEVADNLERALQEAGEALSPLARGLQLVHREFARALEQAGVERLNSIDQPFDPALHEAVGTLESEAEEGTILQEVAPGYLYRGALLRPAKVVIAR